MHTMLQRRSDARPCDEKLGVRMVVATGVVATLLSLGCSGGPVCQELGNCGGNPVGAWAQKPGGKLCQEHDHRPPPEEYLLGQPSPVARIPVPESTNVDWCLNLIITPGAMNAIKKNLYYWENFPYRDGLINYKPSGDYSINFSRAARVSQYYSRTCLTQYGHGFACDQFQEKLFAANEGNPAADLFECTEDKVKGGCNCSFRIIEVDTEIGVYSVSGNIITHFSQTPAAHFNRAVACVRGDTMEISGMNNSFLWNRPGFRTTELVRVDCEDGKQGPGELGVDCGQLCPNACPAN